MSVEAVPNPTIIGESNGLESSTEPKIPKIDPFSGFDKDDEGIENLVNSLGDKSEDMEESLQRVCYRLSDDWSNKKEAILNAIIKGCLFSSEKITIYTTLIGLLNKHSNERSSDFVKTILDQIKAFQSNVEVQPAIQSLFILLADIVNVSILRPSSLIEHFGHYLNFIKSDESCQMLIKAWLVFCIGNAIPYVGQICKRECESEFIQLYETVCILLDSEQFQMIAQASSVSKDLSNGNINCFSALSACLKELASKEWKENIILRPYSVFNFDSSILQSISVEPDFQDLISSKFSICDLKFPSTMITIFTEGTKVEKEETTDANDQQDKIPQQAIKLHSEYSAERYLIKFVLHQIYDCHSHAHKVCAANMLNIKSPSLIPCLNDYIVEVVFEKMFFLSNSSDPGICAVSVLFELTHQKETEITPSIYQALKFFFNNIEQFNIQTIDVFCQNFAHYISNNDYKWIWEEYGSYCHSAQSTTKGYFIRELIKRILSYTYHDRLAHELNEEMYVKTGILPKDPEPNLHLILTKVTEAGYDDKNYLILKNLVTDKAKNEEIFKFIETLNTNQHAQTIYLLALIFEFGHKSTTHFNAAVNKFMDTLKNLTNDALSKVFLLQTICEICQSHPVLLKISIGTFYEKGILSLESLLNFIFDPAKLDQLCSPMLWQVVYDALLFEKAENEDNLSSNLVMFLDKVSNFLTLISATENIENFNFYILTRIKFLMVKISEFVDLLPLIMTKVNEITEKYPGNQAVETLKWFCSILK